jgi:hypothetical protein
MTVRLYNSRWQRRRISSRFDSLPLVVPFASFHALCDQCVGSRTFSHSNCHSEARQYRARNLLFCGKKQIPPRLMPGRNDNILGMYSVNCDAALQSAA